MKKPISLLGILFLTFTLLSGCTKVQSESSITLPNTSSIAVLPFHNLAQTPQAGEKVEAILTSLLRSKGFVNVHTPPGEQGNNLALLLDDTKRIAMAKTWANEKGLEYGITGTIQEWAYRTGLDGEPAVGITLAVIKLPEDKVIWTATASRTGWGFENLSGTTMKVLNAMLTEFEL
jgi:TolB-like protein